MKAKMEHPECGGDDSMLDLREYPLLIGRD
jgi:hypothetical protein